MVGAVVDGEFGKQSVAKLQEWINRENTVVVQPIKPTKVDKIIAKINEYAYPYGTATSKYSYKKGSPKTAYKSALRKYMKKKARISQSDCGYFVSTVIRATGIDKNFDCLDGYKWGNSKALKIVFDGKNIKSGLLKAGDIIRYKKKNGGQHTLFCYSNGKIAEAGRGHWFPAIKKDKKKYNKANVKKVQVLRVK